MSISIGPTLLHFAARHVDDDPELAAMLAGLNGVRVKIYEINGDAERVAQRMNRMSVGLGDQGWSRVATVKDHGDVVHMLVREQDGCIVGLTVLVSDGISEAVVVNLMGDIDPANFSGVMVALDLDQANLQDVQVQESG